MTTIEQTIQREAALVLAIPTDQLERTTPLVEYGLDSVRAMEIIAGIEDLFDIEVADTDIAKLHTVADLAAYVERERMT